MAFGRKERSAAELAEAARRASEVRALTTQPDVVALRVEEVRRFVDRLFGTSVVLGLMFTMVSVQQFAAQGSAFPSLGWWAAWLLDPIFSFALIGVLVAEVVTARYQIQLGFWPDVSKWVFLGAVLTMNTWAAVVAKNPAQIALHAAPVVAVFVVAQIAPVVREKLTQSVIRAAEEAREAALDVHIERGSQRAAEEAEEQTQRVVDHQPPDVVPQQVSVLEKRAMEPVVIEVPHPVVVVPPPVVRPDPVPEAMELPDPEPEVVVAPPGSAEMSPAVFLVNAWRFGRRVSTDELYTKFPDRQKASLRSVMSVTRKKHPDLEPPVRVDREEEQDGNERRQQTG